MSALGWLIQGASAQPPGAVEGRDTTEVQGGPPESPTDSSGLELTVHEKALLKSAVVPGWGQIQNGQAWKTAIIYVGAGTLIYLVRFNNENYQEYRTAYNKRVDGDSSTIDKFEGRLPTRTLQSTRDFYRRNRDLSYIGLGVLYILNLIDAYVYSHLSNFDISDDLSLNLRPLSPGSAVRPSGRLGWEPSFTLSYRF